MDYIKSRINSKRLALITTFSGKNRDEKATLLAAVEIQRKARLIKDLIVHLSFFVVFLVIAILQLYPDHVYNINIALKNDLLFDEIDNLPYPKTYMEIDNSGDFQDYMLNLFGPKIEEMSFQNDGAMNKIIGSTVRIRTMRVRKNSCANSGGYDNINCYAVKYDHYSKDRSSFGTNDTFAYTSNCGGSFVFGYNQYVWDRSGHYIDLPIENITQSFQYLFDNGFFDVQTRAVVLSFSTFNVNYQSRATVSTLLTEWSAAGQVDAYYSLRTYRVEMYLNSIDRFRAFLEVAFVLFLIYYVFSFINEARIDYGLNRITRFFSSFRNFFDILNIVLFIVSVGLYLAFLGDSNRTVDINDEIEYPTYLESLGQTALVLYQISAINILLMAFKTFRFLIVHRRLYVLWITISESKLQLITFTIMFIIMMMGFLMSGWLTFGGEMAPFNGFVSSLGTLLQFIIGNPPDYEAMSYTNRALGPIYYLLFTIFMFFILVNMFVAIISNSYQEISNSLDKKQKEKNYLMTKWQRYGKSLSFLFRGHIYDLFDLVVLISNQRPGLMESKDLTSEKLRDEIQALDPKIKVDEACYYADLLMKVHRTRKKYYDQIQSQKNTGITFELKLMGSDSIYKKNFKEWVDEKKITKEEKHRTLEDKINMLNQKLDLLLSLNNINLGSLGSPVGASASSVGNNINSSTGNANINLSSSGGISNNNVNQNTSSQNLNNQSQFNNNSVSSGNTTINSSNIGHSHHHHEKSDKKENDYPISSFSASITKFMCGPTVSSSSSSSSSSSNQDSTLFKVIIDGVETNGVKFLSVSPQWATHVKYFSIQSFSPTDQQNINHE